MNWSDLPDLDDANNWMALAAVLALILSQLPPLVPRVWGRIQGGAVRISTADSFAITHHLGRIYITLFVQIENTGAAPVAVTKIDCVIRLTYPPKTGPGIMRVLWGLVRTRSLVHLQS